ncbi:MAG TPA: FAD-dependent oxidoreductase [Candidatus Omnitrophota bacterium]|nr:FAD-dependent oxidoreductase [Candidatus Omnitrophota bacterium]HOX09503.1 FAD-dependent oxidoreductase [Candidatus Omnitrophota bacterium]
MTLYDLIIIGAGPAGITAAVYAARKKMSLLVISWDIGGQAAWSGDVENYTGYQFISGPELAAKFEEHMRQYGIEVREREPVLGLKKQGEEIIVRTDKGEYRARTVIVASGKKSRELKVPGETEFKNKGLTYCVTCDGPIFSGKDVAVIGGGNSALDAVIQMLKIAKKVYVINNTPELGGEAVVREKIEKSPIATVLNDSVVKAVLGEKMVNAIKIETKGKEQTLAVQGVFVEIGLLPNSDFAGELKRNPAGEIIVNSRNETNIPGIFAAGDVTDVPEKQIIIAAGEGSKACLSAFRYLSSH